MLNGRLRWCRYVSQLQTIVLSSFTFNSNLYIHVSLSLSLSRLLYGLSHVLSVPKKCVNSSLIIFIQFFATVTAAALAPSHFHSLCLFVTLPVYCMFVCLLRLPSLLASTLASICFEITTIPGTQYLCTTVELPLRCPGLSVSFMTAVNCARDWIAWSREGDRGGGEGSGLKQSLTYIAGRSGHWLRVYHSLWDSVRGVIVVALWPQHAV